MFCPTQTQNKLYRYPFSLSIRYRSDFLKIKNYQIIQRITKQKNKWCLTRMAFLIQKTVCLNYYVRGNQSWCLFEMYFICGGSTIRNWRARPTPGWQDTQHLVSPIGSERRKAAILILRFRQRSQQSKKLLGVAPLTPHFINDFDAW